ncbi:MAG: hypothetical protein OXK76_12090 [Gammaproteobacteria bacterium]|nr:hypothetical protein [Gammaproteobacteria bacterium]
MKNENPWLADLMIRRARSLGRVAEEINENGRKAGPRDGLLFEGTMLAEPVLLSLGAEIALKAWQCRERNGAPDQTHDLLMLFDGLGVESQKRLEEKMPEVGSGVRGLPPVYPGMRNALTRCRSVFVDWRYAHEHESLYAETGVLKTALQAIVDAYDEMPQGMAAGE